MRSMTKDYSTSLDVLREWSDSQSVQIFLSSHGDKIFGYVHTQEGTRADEEITRVVASIERPKNREELQRYMGMIVCLAKFCHIIRTFLLLCVPCCETTQRGRGPNIRKRLPLAPGNDHRSTSFGVLFVSGGHDRVH